jgi:serine-type D-Ala-D-Ala carboxypeptidase
MKRKILQITLIITILILIFTTNFVYSQNNPFPPASPESVGISSVKLQIFSDQIKSWLEDDEIVGAVLHIIKSRKTIAHETFGWRDKKKNVPMEKNTICRVRSMTKPFVGTSVLMLAEQNKLTLSDEVSKYITYYKNEKCNEITIEQLLTHTGGFKQPGYPFSAASYKSLQKLVETIGKVGPTHEIGERYFYSDAGSSTLAYLVTVISRVPVEDYIQKNLFDKLSMKNSFCNLIEDDPRRSQVSCTYSGGKGSWRKYWDNSSPQAVPYFRGSGGIYSNTTDYAKFLSIWMNEGKTDSTHFLKPETVIFALSPSSLSRNGESGYGFQWEILDDSKQIFGHGGSDGTLAIADKKRDVIFLYFTQSRGNKTLRNIRKMFLEFAW